MSYPLDKVISALPLTSLYFPDYKRSNDPAFISFTKNILLPKAPNAKWPKQSLGQLWKEQAEEPSPCPEVLSPLQSAELSSWPLASLLMPKSHSPSHLTSGKSVLSVQLCLLFWLIKPIFGSWGEMWDTHFWAVREAGRVSVHLCHRESTQPPPCWNISCQRSCSTHMNTIYSQRDSVRWLTATGAFVLDILPHTSTPQ